VCGPALSDAVRAWPTTLLASWRALAVLILVAAKSLGRRTIVRSTTRPTTGMARAFAKVTIPTALAGFATGTKTSGLRPRNAPRRGSTASVNASTA